MPGMYGRWLRVVGASNSSRSEDFAKNAKARAGLLLPEVALLVPNALAAPFTFEKANCFTLIWIQKLVGLLKAVATRRAVEKSMSCLCLLLVVHAPFLSYRR
jgi:hypothetical protein